MSTLRLLAARIGKSAFNCSQQKQLCCLQLGVTSTTHKRNAGQNITSRTNYSLFSDEKVLPHHFSSHQWRQQFSLNCAFGTKSGPDRAGKSETKAAAVAESEVFGDSSGLGLFAKFKLMYKKYWYVLIPVHCITSIGWFGGFYYLSKSGVDVPALLQYIHLSETIIQKVQSSNMGHYAIAYLCYKVATPVRYAVTLGGTTLSIKYLVQSGLIKPVPTKREIVKMYEQTKANRAAVKAEKQAIKDEAKAAKSKNEHQIK